MEVLYLETVIYIGNESMQLVSGERRGDKLVIDAFAETSLPEGTVLNGVIIGEYQFRNALISLLNEFPDMMDRSVKLVIGGTQFQTHVTDAPKLKDKDMMRWIEGEFISVLDEEDEYIYDYRMLGSSDVDRRAVVCLVKKELIGTYINIFADEGIEIESITSGLDCQIKLMEFLPETRDDSFILLMIDASNLYSCIYIDGEFRVSDVKRIFSERGTPELSSEVERIVSNLIQFAYSEGYAEKLHKVILCGCRRDETVIFKNISERFSIKADILRSDEEIIETRTELPFRLDKYAFAAGGLI